MDSRELPRPSRRAAKFLPAAERPPSPPRSSSSPPNSGAPTPPTPTANATAPRTTPTSATCTPVMPASDSQKNKSNDEPKSSFDRTVCLTDWWLVKAEVESNRKRLAVGGLTSREQQAIRVFTSAPILQTYDVFTLQTTDGICVLLGGFMNKARTVENGFPPEVCDHFIFGFPPHWEEYAEKCMPIGSPPCNVSEHKLDTETLSPQRENTGDRSDISKQHKMLIGEAHVNSPNCDFATAVGEEAHVDGQRRDWGPMQEKIDFAGMLESTETESSTVSQRSTIVRDAEKKLHVADSSSAFSIVSGGPEKESSSGDHVIQNPITLQTSENSIGNRITALVPSMLGQNITLSTTIVKNLNDYRNHEACDRYTPKTVEDDTEKRPLSACRLHKKNAFDNQKRVVLAELSSHKPRVEDISTSDEVVNHTEGRVLTRSMRKLERKLKADEISARISDDGELLGSVSPVGFSKVRSAIASTVGKSGDRKNLNFAANGCKEPTDAMNSRPSVDPVKPKFEPKAKPLMQDKDCRASNTKATTKIDESRAKSSTRSAAPDGRKHNAVANPNKIPENDKVSKTETKRKLTYEIPEKEIDIVSVGSPQSFCFKRSRSGRLIMPTLEFWRNQRAIYDADRTVTGIGEAAHLGLPNRGMLLIESIHLSKQKEVDQEPQRKRGKLQ